MLTKPLLKPYLKRKKNSRLIKRPVTKTSTYLKLEISAKNSHKKFAQPISCSVQPSRKPQAESGPKIRTSKARGFANLHCSSRADCTSQAELYGHPSTEPAAGATASSSSSSFKAISARMRRHALVVVRANLISRRDQSRHFVEC